MMSKVVLAFATLTVLYMQVQAQFPGFSGLPFPPQFLQQPPPVSIIADSVVNRLAAVLARVAPNANTTSLVDAVNATISQTFPTVDAAALSAAISTAVAAIPELTPQQQLMVTNIANGLVNSAAFARGEFPPFNSGFGGFHRGFGRR